MPVAMQEISDLPVTAAVAPGRKGTLLIVDDEEGPRQSLRLVFKDNYHILMATDGPSAIKLAQENRVDVAVLDIRMSGMSGIEILERLKYVDPGIEAVMMTAFETTDTIRQALRLRACDYLNKPFDLSAIRAAVNKAMQRRTLEGELHNNAEQLKQLMSELENQRLEQQIAQTRGDIYASIIHDINGPLTVISGFVQMLNQRIGGQTRLEDEDVQFVKERLKTITRQITNCIEISRRYLNLMRRRPGETHQVGVNELLTDLGQLLRTHPSRQNHDFSMQPLPQNLAVLMNGTDLLQVLQNLAVNGFQCSPRPHSVTIRGTLLAEPLALASLRDGPGDRWLNVESFANTAPIIALSVADTGPGIPENVLPKIFQPYFTTKDAHQGTGLGLNIVQRLLKEARCLLHVHTVGGEGTCFTIYLPAVPPPPS
jgi:two-component system, sensor histidine kinase and response regulator